MRGKTVVLLGLSFGIISCDRGPTSPEQSLSADDAATVALSTGLVRTSYPSAQDPGPPFYARLESVPPHVLIAGDRAVVYFYRDPACIPADFNLLVFFDAPTAFSCTPMVDGFALWHDTPFLGAPKIAHTVGTGAVPVWIFPADVVMAALQDGVLTIGELAALDGRLTGTATFLREVLHPHPLPPFLGGGGHPRPKLIVTARGLLDDGRRFHFHFVRHDFDLTTAQLRIR